LRKYTLTLFTALTLAALPLAAKAQTIDDPLHGFCTGCSDNGTVTTTTLPATFTGQDFGFNISPAANGSGDFQIVLAIPTDEAAAITNVTGTINGQMVSAAFQAGLASGVWNSSSGSLASMFGSLFSGASPTNPENNLANAEVHAGWGGDPTFPGVSTGAFTLLVADLGVQTIPTNPATTGMDLSIAGLPQGTGIYAFFNNPADSTGKGAGWVAAASSGSLFTDAPPPSQRSIPEPASMLVLGTAVAALLGVRRRRS
jgi:hypothetical protein